MPESIDWSLTTYEGNRRRQHAEFRALTLREKLLRIEELGEVAAHLAQQGVGPPLDLPQRMIRRDELLQIERHEHRLLPVHTSTHRRASLSEDPTLRARLKSGSLAAC